MKNLESMQKVIGWRSRKNADGTYTGIVYSVGYKVSFNHAEYTRATRARAVSAAKQAARYLKSQNKLAA